MVTEVNGTDISLKLPIGTGAAPANGAYVLEYNAFVNINKRGNYGIGNVARFGNSSMGTGDDNTVTFHSAFANGGATRIPGRASIRIVVRDETDASAIVGNEYALYIRNNNGTTGALVQKQETDDTGSLYFSGLKVGARYLLRELAAPTGYTVNNSMQTIPITVSAGNVQEVLLTKEIPDPNSGNSGNTGGNTGDTGGNTGEGNTGNTGQNKTKTEPIQVTITILPLEIISKGIQM